MERLEGMEGRQRDILVGREPTHLLQNLDDLWRRRRGVTFLGGNCRVRGRSTTRDGSRSGSYYRGDSQNKSCDGQ